MHILPCDAAQRHRSCDTYPRISPRRRQINWGDGGDTPVAELTGPLRHSFGVLTGRSSALDDDLDTRACSPSVDLSPGRQRLLLNKLERGALTKGLREGLVHAAT